MESKVKFMGHAIHPLLIAFPLGLLLTSVVFDVLALLMRSKRLAISAFHMLGAGVISGLAASVFGLLDWLNIPERTRAKQLGALHGIGNVLVSGLFGVSWLMRRDDPKRPEPGALFLSLIGAVLAGATGWMGGELVERLGVGIDRGAHLNAPNSLSGRPAIEDNTAPERLIIS